MLSFASPRSVRAGYMDVSEWKDSLEGFDYLCQIKDVKSRIVLSESTPECMKAELVVKTIRKALRRWDVPTDASLKAIS